MCEVCGPEAMEQFTSLPHDAMLTTLEDRKSGRKMMHKENKESLKEIDIVEEVFHSFAKDTPQDQEHCPEDYSHLDDVPMQLRHHVHAERYNPLEDVPKVFHRHVK